MVERFNRTLEAMLSKYVSDNQRDWDVHLPLVMMAYRSSVHEATTFTPYFMMFGREICLPIDIMFGTQVDQEPLTHGSYAATLRAKRRMLIILLERECNGYKNGQRTTTIRT